MKPCLQDSYLLLPDNVGESDILNESGLECLILKNNKPEIIAEKILEIGKQNKKWKNNVSMKCKDISSKYNNETQSKLFKEVFYKLLDEI